jgi:hypothetical protein
LKYEIKSETINSVTIDYKTVLSPDLNNCVVMATTGNEKLLYIRVFSLDGGTHEVKSKTLLLPEMDEKNICGHTYGGLPGIHFITNDYFTLDTAKKNITNVYKTADGALLCSLDTRCLAYIRQSITPEKWDRRVTGIYDKISQRIYDPNLETLMHFGAKNLIIGPLNTMIYKEKELLAIAMERVSSSVPRSGKLKVFGNCCPGLTLDTLHDFGELHVEERIEHAKTRRMS